MDAMTALTTRRSIRKYKPEPVSRRTLEKIVNAGRLDPPAGLDDVFDETPVTIKST